MCTFNERKYTEDEKTDHHAGSGIRSHAIGRCRNRNRGRNRMALCRGRRQGGDSKRNFFCFGNHKYHNRSLVHPLIARGHARDAYRVFRVPRVQRLDKRDDSDRRDGHRVFCVPRLQRLDECRNSRRRDERWVFCVQRVRRHKERCDSAMRVQKYPQVGIPFILSGDHECCHTGWRDENRKYCV